MRRIRADFYSIALHAGVSTVANLITYDSPGSDLLEYGARTQTRYWQEGGLVQQESVVNVPRKLPVWRRGADVVTLTGRSFGVADYTLRARVISANGATACVATKWTSQSSIVCHIPLSGRMHQVGGNSGHLCPSRGLCSAVFAITLERRVSTMTQMFWYNQEDV